MKPYKRCTGCGQEFLYTPEHFSPKGNGYLSARCKTCTKEAARARRAKIDRAAKVWISARLVEVNPEDRRDCQYCNHLKECRRRVKIGGWVMCEISEPDDLSRIYLVAPDALEEMLELAEALNATV